MQNTMRAPVPEIAAALLLSIFILSSGCVAPENVTGRVASEVTAATVTPTATITATAAPAANASGTSHTGQEGQGSGTGAEEPAGGTAAGSAEVTVQAPQFSEWKAPDGSITLQVPAGWKASEKQVDTCTANWAVQDAAGTSSAYMTNEILVFKSESARTLLRQYGLTGVDGAPVSDYLNVEQAVPQIIAPLSGSAGVQIFYTYAEETQEFSRAVCIAGLAACDALVFDAAYYSNATLMRGTYLVQTYDFGEGNTWWINAWGYTAPADKWTGSKATLEKTFNSVKYTDAWASKCTGGTAQPADVVGQVIKDRQAASDRAAQAWDEYIRGG
ncbi:MAG: hypothetical protein PHT59_06800 [Candidatus Omnitrophica bacterium]|nr:hypothetical protein [Candidatus Omnitrophota bacterium]